MWPTRAWRPGTTSQSACTPRAVWASWCSRAERTSSPRRPGGRCGRCSTRGGRSGSWAGRCPSGRMRSIGSSIQALPSPVGAQHAAPLQFCFPSPKASGPVILSAAGAKDLLARRCEGPAFVRAAPQQVHRVRSPHARSVRKQVLRSRACRALAQDDNLAPVLVLTPLIPSPFGPHPLSPSPPCGPHPFDPLSLRERGNSVRPSFPLSTFVERGTGGEDYGGGTGREDTNESERACHPERRR